MSNNLNNLKQRIKDANLSKKQISELLYFTEQHHYAEKPVDIIQFIEDEQYLGNIYKNKIYPFWLNVLEKIYPTPFYSPYFEIILSLPIGAGKTSISTIGILYDLYKLSCLNYPQEKYGLLSSTIIVFGLFSATLNLAGDVNWTAITEAINSSPYFSKKLMDSKEINKKHGSLSTTLISKKIGIQIGSRFGHAHGKAVFGVLLDEASFQSETSNQAQETYNTLLSKMESRFMDRFGSIPGHMWLASSPNHATDFLQRQIEKAKNSKRTLIIDGVPIWDISPKFANLTERFYVFKGNENADASIIEESNLKNYDNSQIISVPTIFRDSFENDLLTALKDKAGVRTIASTALFKSHQNISNMMLLENIFSKEVIELDFKNNDDAIINYCDSDYFKNIKYPEYNRFIHLDASYSKDRFGIASIYCVLKDKNLPDLQTGYVLETDERLYFVDFCLALKSKEGQEIPLYKVEEFILHLKSSFNYPIACISADTFQSKRTLQTFELKNIATQNISTVRTKDPYFLFRDLINANKLFLVKHELVKKEMIELKDLGDVIEHPAVTGSKDITDAIAGALWACKNSKNILNTAKLTQELLVENDHNEDVSIINEAVIGQMFNGLF